MPLRDVLELGEAARLAAEAAKVYVPLFRDVPAELLARYFTRVLTDAQALAVLSGPRGLSGCAGISELAFDSATFGRRMARVDAFLVPDPDSGAAERLLRRVVERACTRDLGHLHLRVPTTVEAWSSAGPAAGFERVSANVFFERPLATGSRVGSTCLVRRATPADLAGLLRITGESFSSGTRFHVDPVLALRATALHEGWVANAMVGEAADEVLVAEISGAAEGYITIQWRCDFEPLALRVVEIGLLAVSTAHRGAGVGRALLVAAIERAQALGADRLIVDTEADNVAARGCYEKIGFRPTYSTLSFHRHLGGRAS